MAAPQSSPNAPPDRRVRSIVLFVIAVLLPSVALSVVSFDAVPKLAENLKLTLLRQAESMLFYIERDLEEAVRQKASEAARIVGPERLLEGRPEAIQQALVKGGWPAESFESLRVEASMPLVTGAPSKTPDEMIVLREALSEPEVTGVEGIEDSVPLERDGKPVGKLRFQFSREFATASLLPRFFERNPEGLDGSWFVRVREPEGRVLYENAPSPDGRFEVSRVLSIPTFRGLVVELRPRGRSIDEEVRRLSLTKNALIAFIDVMLLGGLYLVFTNVRREMHLARLKSDFVANVSHELKTPLALIRLFAETLELGRVQSEEKKNRYYRIINNESQRLTRLIDNILDFSRIEAGRKHYRFASGDVARIVEEVVEAYRFPVEQQGFTLELDLADDLPEIEVDHEALAQAVINLLNNAVKYSRDEKHITVRVARQDQRILVAVADRGIGVDKADQKRIFEQFFRAEDSLVHETKGSGLGLSLVRHIIDAHGGTIEVVSAPGRGSTFTLILPIGQLRSVNA